MAEKTVSESIEDSANDGIIRSQSDSGSVEEHSLPDRIAADRYVEMKKANAKGLPMRYVKFVPPGAV